MDAIRSKRQMYRLLSEGAFGNTIPQYFSLAEWHDSGDAERYAMWGVRTLTPGGPCRLYCPYEEVEATVRAFQPHAVNLSVMIDAVCDVSLWADVYDSDTGLLVYGIEYPPKGASWRALMPSQGREWRGLQAVLMLRKHLNPSSLADLESLREHWPGHVYELSACSGPFGRIPGRNAVVWEVRKY